MGRGRPYNRATAAGQRLAMGLHSSVYDATGGRLGGRLMGAPVLLLVTTGRKTGKERTAPLLYLEDGGDYVIVASNGGAPKHPAWWLNPTANPEAKVRIGEKTLRVRAGEAKGEEKRRLWGRLVHDQATFPARDRCS